MRIADEVLQLTATDLVGHLNCRHLTHLDHSVAEGILAKPKVWNPLLEILWERGSIHEQNYIAHLEEEGLDIVRIEGIEITDDAVSETLAAMKDGASVIVQGAFSKDGWSGRTDVLLRIDTPSDFGDWSYEVIDTKLARETKAGAILQLCLYSNLLADAQGRTPENMYVVVPWSDFEPEQYRFADYAAYFRQVKRGLQADLEDQEKTGVYPDPKEHCDICRWRNNCEQQRRDDDHLCLVASISKVQINELQKRGIGTTAGLATLPLPLEWKPERGSVHSYERIREQARLQVEARETGETKFELLPIENGFGLTCLPEPSKGDIFFDLESDRFVGEHGLEYLFGYMFTNDDSVSEFRSEWAFSRAEEKQAFETFVDFVMDRWEQNPDLHIYHYAPYETASLKRLMGQYATREEEIDRMLRGKLFVDLYQIVRQSVRASVENYSLKSLEPFFGFEREVPLSDANAALANLHANLELEDIGSITDETKATVLAYNKDDCKSTAELREWLETLRDQVVSQGTDVPRPIPGDGSPSENISDWLARITPVIEKLTADVPVDLEERTDEQQASWILANIIDWHRREDKAVWWDYFRLAALSADDLLDERAGISGLSFVAEVGGTVRAPIHRYEFPAQETELRGGEDLCTVGGDKFGKIDAISLQNRTVDIKKRQDSVALHPHAVYSHKLIRTQVLADSLLRIGKHVVELGLDGDGPYQAARDLLLRERPRIGTQELQHKGETTVEAAIRLCGHLEGGILAIQGPPGAGKTFTGARMICELVREGKTVGITANSHKVIRHLIDKTIEAAQEQSLDLHCCHKAQEKEHDQPQLSFTTKNEDLLEGLQSNVNVGGGTAWFWSREDAFESIDVLFVDEAAQMSLANVLAVSQAAKTVVLIGDPQQLDQPTQGTHPDGTGSSALDHILGSEQTIDPTQGLFLEETWRLHPDICAFTSELFYECKLISRDGLEKQCIRGSPSVGGCGLYYLPVEHEGNQNSSPEEARTIVSLVEGILASNASWVDLNGDEHPLTLDDVLVITPYNAQAFEIQEHLPEANVGTVDKFQGQEAPIAIYSTATSSHADAPRGMEFLYSLNRLNVATSRARCASILVGSPQIFEAECKTPRQMQLANAFCRYLEMAAELKISNLQLV